MPRAVTACGGGRTDFAVLESAVFWYYGADVSSVKNAKSHVTQATNPQLLTPLR